MQAEANNASSKISELRDKLEVHKMKGNNASVTSQSDTGNSWEIAQMRKSHDEEIAIFKDTHRTVVRQLMNVQETNRDLMDSLTNRDEQLKNLGDKVDDSFYVAVTVEISAMRKAFEKEIATLNKEVELARADIRRMTQQLKDQHINHEAALKARAELLKFDSNV